MIDTTVVGRTRRTRIIGRNREPMGRNVIVNRRRSGIRGCRINIGRFTRRNVRNLVRSRKS